MMQQAHDKQVPTSPAQKPSNGHYHDASAESRPRRPPPSQFDLVVTFESDQLARDALLSLRREGFGPDQAVLLTPGPLAQDEFELATEEMRSESYFAFGIIVVTEIALGGFVGAVIGWLAGLFHFAPQIGPVWQPILILAAIGCLCGAVVSFFEFRRWQRVHLPSPGEAAIAIRLRGPTAPARLVRAQEVLQQFGGLRETG